MVVVLELSNRLCLVGRRAHELLANLYFIVWSKFASREAERALRIAPHSIWAQMISSCLDFHENKIDEAIRLAEDAVQCDPALSAIPVDQAGRVSSRGFYCDNFSGLASQALQRRKIELGIVLGRKALAIAPTCVPGMEILSEALLLNGDRSAAKRLSEQVLTMNPQSRLARQILGLVH